MLSASLCDLRGGDAEHRGLSEREPSTIPMEVILPLRRRSCDAVRSLDEARRLELMVLKKR